MAISFCPREKVRLRGDGFGDGVDVIESEIEPIESKSPTEQIPPHPRPIASGLPSPQREGILFHPLQRAELGQKIPQDAVIKLRIDKVEPVVIAARDEVNLFRGPGGGEYPLRVGA